MCQHEEEEEAEEPANRLTDRQHEEEEEEEADEPADRLTDCPCDKQDQA